jgi:hypothetical protein
VAAVAAPSAVAWVDGSTAWSGPGTRGSGAAPLDVQSQSWPGVDPISGQDYPVWPVQIVSRPDGFDWGDAGIGAGATFGVVLGASALVVTRRAGSPTTA